MANTFFDTFTQGLSRQLPTSAAVTSEDRQRKRKRNNNGGDRKKVFARCNGQVSACETFVQTSCAGSTECVAK